MTFRWHEYEIRGAARHGTGAAARCTAAVSAVLTCALLSGCTLPGRAGPVPPSLASARQLTQRGTSAMQRGDWKAAEQFLQDATKICPVDAEARRQYAEALWHRGAYDPAIAQLEEALKLSGDDPQLHVRLGEMHLAQRRPSDALRQADEALDLDPKFAAGWALHGKALEASAQMPHALADYQRALAYRRDDRDMLLETAELYRQTGRPQRALVALQSLLDTYPAGEEPQPVLVAQGLVLNALNRPDDAVDSFALAAQRGPATPDLMFRLAEAQLAAGRMADAQRAAEQGLALEPSHEPTRILLERIQLAQRPSTLR